MGNGKRDRRRIVDPRGHRVPAFIRLCEAFVENLSQVLRLGLVIGGIVLVQELSELRETFSPPVAPDQAHMEKPEPPANTDEPPASLLTDDVIHAQNCTHKEYWSTHYDECFPDGSDVYPRPNTADPDDTGFILYEARVLYARLRRD